LSSFFGVRARRILGAVGAALVVGLLAPLGVIATAAPASATVYDSSATPLKFTQAKRSAVSPVSATGTAVGDIMKYAGVATIGGVVVDAIITTVAIDAATINKYDEGSAVTSPPPGSSQSVDDLFMSNLTGSGSSLSMVTYNFTFYEGGTYTGPGTGVPVTLGNVSVNSYDIDGTGGVKQFIDFKGFQTYLTYSESSSKGLDLSDQGNGNVRFLTRDGSLNVSATSGSYSFSRVQVNYDQISSFTTRIGETGGGTAYYALDFSAGGIWTTNGTTPVTPTQNTNPFNHAPTTSDITTFFAAQSTGYVFRASDFPFADIDGNAMASVKVSSVPSAGTGILEYLSGTTWVPVSAGDVISVNDLDLGKLQLTPSSTGGSFQFAVNDGLVFSTPATLTYTTTPSSQTIDFANPGTKNGNSQQVFASGATASSGLTPTLTSLSTGVCTVSGLTITTLALPASVTTATCVVIASQQGDATYGRAEAVTQQFSVTKLLGQTITFAKPADREYSSSTIASGATTDAAGRTVTLTSLSPTVCTVSGLTITPLDRGVCTVRATQPGDSTYAAASPVTQSFTLTKNSQTITFAQPGTYPVSTASLTVAPTASSGLAATVTSGTPAVCTVSSTTVTIVGAGLCTLTGHQAGDASYSAAADVTRSFHVIAVTTAALPDGQEGVAYTASQTLSGAAGGGTWSAPSLPAGLSIDPSTGEISGTPTIAGTASYAITYTEDGASHAVTLPLTVVAASALTPQTITFVQPSAVALSAGSITVTFSADSGLPVSTVSTTTAVCTISGTTVTLVSAGTCSLTASQPGDSSYAAATDATRSFAVIAITTASLPAGQAGTAYSTTYALAGAAGGGTWTAVSTLPAGLTLDATTGELHGTPSAAFSGTVDVTYTEGAADAASSLTLDIAAAPPAAQTITFAQPGTAARSASPVTLTATTDASGLTPALASSTPAVCTVSGSSVTFTGTGTCTITASQPGDATYSAAADVTHSFSVIGITTGALPSGRAGDAYVATLLASGGTRGGTWTATPLPSGVTLDPATGALRGTPSGAASHVVTVTYTEGGVTDTRTFPLAIASAAAPAPSSGSSTPTRANDREPAPAAVPALVATTKPRTTVLGQAKPQPTKQDMIDFGSGTQVAAASSAPVLSNDQLAAARRTIDQLAAEPISGFAPGSSAEIDLLGARTLATFAVAGPATVDATTVAKAVRDATVGGDTAEGFAVVRESSAIAASAAEKPSARAIPSADIDYFTYAALAAPVALGSLDTSSANDWVHFSVDVTGYRPGTTVYLAMTSTPVVFASAVVGKDGTATVAGDMALDTLPAGVHHLRVVGDRILERVTVGSAGSILLDANHFAQIQQFDQGTNATVRVSGDNSTGGSQVAVRIIPLDLDVPWWLLWVLVGLALVLVTSRLARFAEAPGWAWTKRIALVLVTAVPVAAGLLIDVPLLAIASGLVTAAGLALSMALPKLRREDLYEYGTERSPAYDAWGAARV